MAFMLQQSGIFVTEAVIYGNFTSSHRKLLFLGFLIAS